MSDLFGSEAEAPVLTCFSADLDRLCREKGGWPDGAIAYAVEVIGQGDDPQILATGEVPTGIQRDGRAKFGPKGVKYKVCVLLSEYRAALGIQP